MDYIEPTQILECTQKIGSNTNKSNQVVGHLLIKGINYNLFHGENTIGRDPGCSIVVNDKPVSAKHAVLEVENETLHCIYDLGSSNKTKLRKAFIKPNVRYVLSDGDELVFGNVPAIYNHVKIIPEELENEVGRTEILTIPETPEKEDKPDFVAELPRSTICDSDDSNTDLFDDSQSGRINFQIPNFKDKEVNKEIIYGICTQSNIESKNVSIYDVDTQSFVNEKNSLIYDFETKAFNEKLKDDTKKTEINEGPILSKPSGSLEDLFCDSVQSPKSIFSNSKDKYQFSEDIFPASQGIEEVNYQSFVNIESQKIHNSKDLKSQNCIASTSGLSKAFEHGSSSNDQKEDQKITDGQNVQIDSNLEYKEEVNHGQIEPEFKKNLEKLSVNEEKLESSNQQNVDQIEQDGLIYENKINFVENKNFWVMESEVELTTKDHKQLETESLVKLGESSNQQNAEVENEDISAIQHVTSVDEDAIDFAVSNNQQNVNLENEDVCAIDKIDFAVPKNLWETETEVFTTKDQQLKNNLDKILEDVESEKVPSAEERKLLKDDKMRLGGSSNQKNLEVENEDKINFSVPKDLWEMKTEVLKKELKTKSVMKLDKISNQQNLEVENEDIYEIQQVANYENKIDFAVPKNLWEMETEVLTTDLHIKNNLEKSEGAILKDNRSEKVISVEEIQVLKHDEMPLDESLNQKNLEIENEDKINFSVPKNLWEMDTEIITTEDQQLQNNLEKSEVIILEGVDRENVSAEEIQLLKDDEMRLDESSNQQYVEVENEDNCAIQQQDKINFAVTINQQNVEVGNEDNSAFQHATNVNNEDKIDFDVPKNLWEMETQVFTTEDQQLKNDEKNEVAAILEYVQSEKVASAEEKKILKNDQISNQQNVEVENEDICAIQHKSEDKINFVEPENLWNMETEELTTEDYKQLKDNLEKRENVSIFEDVQSEKVLSVQENKEKPQVSINFKIPNSVQEENKKSGSVQKDDPIDSTLEDEDFEGFEPIECITTLKNNKNQIISESKNSDVESEMAKLFGTSSNNEIKNVMNGEENVNFLKKMLEDTHELEKINTEDLQDKKNVSKISEMPSVQPIAQKVDPDKTKNCNEFTDLSSMSVEIDEVENQNLKQSDVSLSEMCTQAVINLNQNDLVEQNKDLNPCDDNLDMSLSDMCTQAVPINSTDVVEKTTQDIKVDQNNLNLSETDTQAVLINSTVIDALEKTTQDIKVDQNNLNLSETDTQAVLMNSTEIDLDKSTQDINVDQNNHFSEMSTQAVLINSTEIDLDKITQGIKFDKNNLNLSEMSTQAVLTNSNDVDLDKSTQDINVDQNNASEIDTQAILINSTEIDLEKSTQDINVDQNNLNLTDMDTQAVLINSTKLDVVQKPTQDVKVNLNLSEMDTQAVLTNSTKLDVVQKPTQDIKVNLNLSEMDTQAVLINSTKLDVVQKPTQDVKVNLNLSEMDTQAVLTNSTKLDVVQKPTQDIKVNLNLSEMDTQAVLINSTEIDVVEKTTQGVKVDQNNLNLSEMDTQAVLINPLSIFKGPKTQNDNLPTSNISQDNIVIPSKKIRKSRINTNLNKTEINLKNSKPNLALQINKHSSTLPNINRSSFFVNQQKTSQSLILENKKNLFDSSDDEDTCPNKRPRLFVISDDEDETKSETAFEIEFKETKSKLKNKIYNSNDSIYSSVSMDETVVKNRDSDMDETLISEKCNKNIKFTMSPFLSKIIEVDEPKTVSPNEFGRGKRTRVAKKFKDFETETGEPQEIKKFKLGIAKKGKKSDEISNEEEIQQPSGSQVERKQKISRLAKSQNLNSNTESDESHKIRKNKRSRKTPIVKLGNNEENILNKPSKNIKSKSKPEKNPDFEEENDCTENDRSSRKRRTAASESSSWSKEQENKAKNIQNPSKVSKNIKKSEENISVEKSKKEEDCTKNERSSRRRKIAVSLSSNGSSSSSKELENNENNIRNPTKMTKNVKKSEENISVEKSKKEEDSTENYKSYERSSRRKKAVSESSNGSFSSTKEQENKTKSMKKSSEENPKKEKDCTENGPKTYERLNRKRTTQSASETSSNCSIASSSKEQENIEKNIQSTSKMSKNIKKSSEENLKNEKYCTENNEKTNKKFNNRKKTTKSSAFETSSNSTISSSSKEQENKEKNIQKPSKMSKNIKKSTEESSKNEKDCTENEQTTNRKKTTKAETSSNVPISTSTTSTRVTRSRGKNENGKLRILFNGNYDEDMPLIIDRLNGEIVENPYTCTVVIAEKFEPTVNFLCGLSQGRPIVSSSWLHCSRDAGYFIDPYKHLLVDKEAEEKFSFCLKNSINKATQSQLLKGWSIFVTPSTQPSPTEFKSIIECSGGVFLKKLPTRRTKNWFVISCPDDEIKSKITPKIVSCENFITCVLRQALDF